MNKLFSTIRKCKKCKYISNCINVPQPGLWRNNTNILFIGENPGVPKPTQILSDAILLEKNIDDNIFHKAYEDSQRSWKFYDFIINFCNWKESSIINVCRCPTKFNKELSLKMIENCNEYLLKSITLINPQIIICVGKIAQERVKRLNLKKIKIINSLHYSYLLRKGEDFMKKEINKIKKEIQPTIF